MFFYSKSHEVRSFTRKMHGRVQKERRDRRKGDEKKTDSEDTEPEEEFKDEMDNFQDILLGSMTPVVRREVNSPQLPPI